MSKKKMQQVGKAIVSGLAKSGYEPLLSHGQFLVRMPENDIAAVIVSIVPYFHKSGDNSVNLILGLRFPVLQGLLQGFRDGTCRQVETDPTWAIVT